MGAWGDGIYDNDSALDWLRELHRRGWPHLTEALATVESGTAMGLGRYYLDVDDGSSGLAACDAVARLAGHPGRPEPVDAWVASQSTRPDNAMLRRALDALVRIENRQISELASLRHGPTPNAWLVHVQDLRRRLQLALGPRPQGPQR